MAEAKSSLSPKALERMQRHRHAVIVLARREARKAVKRDLRSRGVRLSYVSVREIAALANDYLAQHRTRLVAEAEEIIETWPGFASFRTNISTSVQTDLGRYHDTRRQAYADGVGRIGRI